MKRPVWLLKETVLALHERLLADFGGSAGLRDEGLLDSALARPENLFAYGTPTVFELAASYAFGLVKNHPFIDGNKRVGFAAALVFLEINGRSLPGVGGGCDDSDPRAGGRCRERGGILHLAESKLEARMSAASEPPPLARSRGTALLAPASPLDDGGAHTHASLYVVASKRASDESETAHVIAGNEPFHCRHRSRHHEQRRRVRRHHDRTHRRCRSSPFRRLPRPAAWSPVPCCRRFSMCPQTANCLRMR